MKKILLLPVLGLAALVASSQAQLLTQDPFDYSPGAIAGLNGGTGWGGAYSTGGSAAPVIVSGNISAPTGYEFIPTGNRVENTGNGFIGRNLAGGSHLNLGADNTYYMSWLIETTVIGDVSRLNLADSGFANRIAIGKLSNANNNLSIQLSGESAVYSTTSLTGGSFLIVAKLQSASGTVTVSASAFSSAGSVGAEPVTWDIAQSSTSVDVAKSMVSLNNLMQGTSGNIGFDEFRLGTTYASVVPEPSSAALLGLGLAGLAYLRRRQQKQA